MSLGAGARLGSYEIIAKLGEGGMGEVYRARDSKLGRDVAIKVLPAAFANDPDRLARFEREAKTLAALNHQNIAHVYDAQTGAGGVAFLVMELVDGEDLSAHIARGAIPHAEALTIARQIAAALESAHDQGVVHRDLKPANVKVREDGTVKVLDFGLAKAMASDAEGSMSGVANSPTLTARATQIGMIIGTAAYMSPEQAKGRAVDRRADVWAFGAVVFEMLAGRRAFEGDDISEVLASVLKSEPDWTALPADVPAPLRRLLKRCLEKDPRKRLRDIGEGLLQLDETMAGASASSLLMPGGGSVTIPAETARQMWWRRALPIAGAIAVTGLVAFAAHRWTLQAPASPTPVRFRYQPLPVPLASSSARREISISPDGHTMVFVGQPNSAAQSLYVRRLDQLDAAPLRGGEGGVAPIFSPDNNWVAFLDVTDQTFLKRVAVLGGPALPICRVSTTVMGAAWLRDGRIVMGVVGNGLQVVSEAGGTPDTFLALDQATKESEHLWPSVVTGTSLVVYVVNMGTRTPLANGQLAVVDVATKRVTRLGISGSHPRYVSTGHLLFAVEDGSVRAVRFDPATVTISGNPVPVLETVTVKPSGAAGFDVSDDGTLVYTTGGGAAGIRTVAWVDRAGKETAIAAPARNYFYARLAPDGSRLSLDVRDQDQDVWIWDLERGSMSRLTDSPGADQYGLWTLDNARIVYSAVTASGATELFWRRSDAIGKPEQITDKAAGPLVPFPNAITPDSKQVIFRAATVGTAKNDLYIASISGGDGKARKLLATEHDEKNAALSPDGRYMAFESDLSGKLEVYVRPLPNVDDRQWTVSTAGGSKPLWAASGREIFYLAPDGKLMSVSVDPTRGLEMGKPVELFDTGLYFLGAVGRNYDVTRDGKRFVMIKNPASGAGGMAITVVVNWAEELKARLK